MPTKFDEAGKAINPIDALIQQSLDRMNLAPSAEADRRTLIRRLHFDLLGLPPKPEVVEAFVTSKNPKAYDKLVDQLLASPHYGERFARHWLDIAHYADTHGFERDKLRPHAWPYRDYVISAFNEDKPYMEFLREQIAGDVLRPDDEDAVIATGFLAAGPWDFVGQVETRSGVLRRSARTLDLDDMVTQVFTSALGVTLNCARCHDHKLDPISQEEYYRITAVFAGVKRADRSVSDALKDKLVKERLQLLEAINRIAPGVDLADVVGGGDGLGSGAFKDGIDPRTGRIERKPMGFLTDIKPNRFSPSPNRFVDGVFIPQAGKDKPDIPISSTGLTIPSVRGADGKAWDVIRNGPVDRTHSTVLGGVDFTKEGNALLGLHANAGITFDLAELRRTVGRDTLRFTSQVGYFGTRGDNSFADARVYVDGREVVKFLKLKRSDSLQDMDIPLPASVRFLTLIATASGNGIGMDQVGFGNPKLKAPETELPEKQRRLLADLHKRKKTLDEKIGALGTGKVHAVVPETKMPEVRILERGNPEAPTGVPLAPGALSALQMLDPDLGSVASTEAERRLALAHWITHEDNPLVYRVMANRLWQWTFGNGIVETSSDFGRGGQKPTHPELLDWLAEELRTRNGSIKAITRLIVTSVTYRQVSHTAHGMAADADNRFLWRQTPRRLQAEEMRDAVLATSGKLNLKAGGPGYRDFKYTEAYAPIYRYITPDTPDLWRRSIYRFVVRTTPHEFLTTLDCPDPSNLTPKRLTTTTPLQALTLSNNPFMLKQVGYFAARLKQDAGAKAADQVDRAFRLALGRPPEPAESKVALQTVRDKGLFALCHALLNANEFAYVD
ncbi:MAG: DUF1553 domain-containing protein [Pirellulaceae bacterium]